jgi:hypothetical protein
LSAGECAWSYCWSWRIAPGKLESSGDAKGGSEWWHGGQLMAGPEEKLRCGHVGKERGSEQKRALCWDWHEVVYQNVSEHHTMVGAASCRYRGAPMMQTRQTTT